MSYENPTCWVTYYSGEDASAVTVFETEIEALRCAVGTMQDVIELPFGVSLGDAIRARFEARRRQEKTCHNSQAHLHGSWCDSVRQPETGPDQGAG